MDKWIIYCGLSSLRSYKFISPIPWQDKNSPKVWVSTIFVYLLDSRKALELLSPISWKPKNKGDEECIPRPKTWKLSRESLEWVHTGNLEKLESDVHNSSSKRQQRSSTELFKCAPSSLLFYPIPWLNAYWMVPPTSVGSLLTLSLLDCMTTISGNTPQTHPELCFTDLLGIS